MPVGDRTGEPPGFRYFRTAAAYLLCGRAGRFGLREPSVRACDPERPNLAESRHRPARDEWYRSLAEPAPQLPLGSGHGPPYTPIAVSRAVCASARPPHSCGDRKSVVWGKSVSVRVDLGGCSSLKKKNEQDKKDISDKN